jgi:hypothetical protein
MQCHSLYQRTDGFASWTGLLHNLQMHEKTEGKKIKNKTGPNLCKWKARDLCKEYNLKA